MYSTGQAHSHCVCFKTTNKTIHYRTNNTVTSKMFTISTAFLITTWFVQTCTPDSRVTLICHHVSCRQTRVVRCDVVIEYSGYIDTGIIELDRDEIENRFSVLFLLGGDYLVLWKIVLFFSMELVVAVLWVSNCIYVILVCSVSCSSVKCNIKDLDRWSRYNLDLVCFQFLFLLHVASLNLWEQE